ncbi:SPFH domain-containing protein [Nocardiopsis alba]|uniref:SPFH domain-containing protein n=1 Tax=Nocardiopsis alba TaxID=53437 RepID=UPI0033B39DA1
MSESVVPIVTGLLAGVALTLFAVWLRFGGITRLRAAAGWCAETVRIRRRPGPGEALFVSGRKGDRVALEPTFVIPLVERVETVSLRLLTFDTHRTGDMALRTRLGGRVDVRLSYFLRISHSERIVLNAVHALGTTGISDHETVREINEAKFDEALKTAAMRYTTEELFTEREEFRSSISDFFRFPSGMYTLEDISIDHMSVLVDSSEPEEDSPGQVPSGSLIETTTGSSEEEFRDSLLGVTCVLRTGITSPDSPGTAVVPSRSGTQIAVVASEDEFFRITPGGEATIVGHVPEHGAFRITLAAVDPASLEEMRRRKKAEAHREEVRARASRYFFGQDPPTR